MLVSLTAHTHILYTYRINNRGRTVVRAMRMASGMNGYIVVSGLSATRTDVKELFLVFSVRTN